MKLTAVQVLLFRLDGGLMSEQCRIVQKPVNANPGLKVNRIITFSSALLCAYICYWPAGSSVEGKTVTEILKMLPEAAGRGQHFQALFPGLA